MTIFLATFLVLGLVVTGMAIGVIVSDKRIKGSCGGLNNIPGIQKQPCLCENPCEDKLKRMAQEESSAVAPEKTEHTITFRRP